MSRLFHLLLRDSQTLRRTRSIRDNIPQRTDITILRKLTTPGTRYRLGRCKWSAPTGKGAHWLHHVTSDHDKMMIISKMLMLVKILWQDKSNIKALFTLLQILNIHQYESQIIYITTYPPTLCRWSWPRPWCGWNSGRPCHRAAFFVLPFFAVEGAVAFWAPGLISCLMTNKSYWFLTLECRRRHRRWTGLVSMLALGSLTRRWVVE